MRASFFISAVLSFQVLAAGVAAAQEVYSSELHQVRAVTVAEGLRHPWGLAFLPDGAMIVTEREGAVRVVGADGAVSAPLQGMPSVAVGGQGGILDVVLDPDFAANRLVYISFSEPGAGGASTAVLRARLNEARTVLEQPEIIFSQQPKSRGGRHFGSRLVFAPDGSLFITLGDRGERRRVQDKRINRGQVIRINPDGTIPADNPFAGGGDGRPEVWSHGHRNIQGAALNPATGALWTHEHGARGGDEINIPEAGKNYGWPVISYGRHYSGLKIGEGTEMAGLEQPLYYWDPSIAPSGMAFYTAGNFPAWTGSLFVGSLKFGMLVRLTLDGDRIVGEERLLEDMDERIRDVRQGPDGNLFLLIDDFEGRILRLEPA